MASTGDHLKLTYQSGDSSWSQLYNAYPDKLFNLGVFDEGFYSMQAAWYASQACKSSLALQSYIGSLAVVSTIRRPARFAERWY